MGAIGAAIGAGAGLVNHNQKKAEYNREKELQARQEALSPWTGVHGDISKLKDPNMFDSVLQGGLTGASMGAGGMGGMMGGAAANPMAGAQQIGVNPNISAFAQQPGNGQMAGGYGFSPWDQAQKLPTFTG